MTTSKTKMIFDYLGYAFIFVAFLPICLLSWAIWSENYRSQLLVFIFGIPLTIVYYLLIIWLL
jgi:TRAP-type C4-dicarboxylate transport system permease small subunit